VLVLLFRVYWYKLATAIVIRIHSYTVMMVAVDFLIYRCVYPERKKKKRMYIQGDSGRKVSILGGENR
jgi:hypothetical protein